jgi:hypothetical protein
VLITTVIPVFISGVFIAYRRSHNMHISEEDGTAEVTLYPRSNSAITDYFTILISNIQLH